MTAECYICGKSPARGNSIRQRGKPKYLGGNGRKTTGITKRWFKPNLQKIHIQNGEGPVHARVCTQCIRSGMVQKKIIRAPFTLPAGPAISANGHAEAKGTNGVGVHSPNVPLARVAKTETKSAASGARSSVKSPRSASTALLEAPPSKRVQAIKPQVEEVLPTTVESTTRIPVTFYLEPRRETRQRKLEGLAAEFSKDVYHERFRRIYLGIGDRLSQCCPKSRFEVICEPDDKETRKLIEEVFPTRCRAFVERSRPIVKVLFRISALTCTLTMNEPEAGVATRIASDFEDEYRVQTPIKRTESSSRIRLGGAKLAPTDFSVVDGNGPIAESYEDVVARSRAGNDSEAINRVRTPLIIIDSGLDLSSSKGEIDTTEVKQFEWNGGRLKDGGGFKPLPPTKFHDVLSRTKNEGWKRHGTRVAIRACGKTNGVYRGAPFWMFTLPYKYSTSQDNVEEIVVRPRLRDIMLGLEEVLISKEGPSLQIVVLNGSWFHRSPDADGVESEEDLPFSEWMSGFLNSDKIYGVFAAGNDGDQEIGMRDLPLPSALDGAIPVGALESIQPEMKLWDRTSSNLASISNNGDDARLEPRLWAIGQDPSTSGAFGTSFSAPVLAAKLLYVYHRWGLEKVDDYLADIESQRIAARFKGVDVEVSVVRVCRDVELAVVMPTAGGPTREDDGRTAADKSGEASLA